MFVSKYIHSFALYLSRTFEVSEVKYREIIFFVSIAIRDKISFPEKVREGRTITLYQDYRTVHWRPSLSPLSFSLPSDFVSTWGSFRRLFPKEYLFDREKGKQNVATFSRSIICLISFSSFFSPLLLPSFNLSRFTFPVIFSLSLFCPIRLARCNSRLILCITLSPYRCAMREGERYKENPWSCILVQTRSEREDYGSHKTRERRERERKKKDGELYGSPALQFLFKGLLSINMVKKVEG